MIRNRGLFLVCVIALVGGLVIPVHTASADPSAFSASPAIINEGNDFATDVMGQAWDMTSYSQISKYLESSGLLINLDNIQVQNGIFSAHSIVGPYFFLLFPSYSPDSIDIGNWGHNYPINSSKYHCFTTRMKTDDPSGMRFFWFQDWQLTAQNRFGFSTSIKPVMTSPWLILSGDLNKMSEDPKYSPLAWNANPTWQGFRIDPTVKSNANFSFDWFRLTDCSPRNVTLSWATSNATQSLYISRSANTADTLISSSISGGSYTLDVSGWEAGDYTLGLQDNNSKTIQWTTLHVQAKPKITISKPSFTSGQAITWNMDSAKDLLYGSNYTRCVTTNFNNGILDLITSPPSAIGGGCTTDGYSDPNLIFKLPDGEFDSSAYRYLTMRAYNEGAYADVNKGWIYRWLWQYYKNGSPDRWCIGVTHDIPFDVGWQTYSMDMFLTPGKPQYVVGAIPNDCPNAPWNSDTINMLRFDPNESGMSGTMHQQIDWISLNKMDSVQRGTLFPLIISASTPIDSLALNYYYTTDPNSPYQSPLTISKPSVSKPNWGTNAIFLPTVINHNNTTPAGNGLNWDTTNVAAGTYNVCIKSSDRYGNTATNCSEAPVKVY